MMTTKLLEVKDLTISFRSREAAVTAVSGISFQLGQGETLGIVGESGCGKSVTSLAIMRLLPRATARVTGEVRFNGQDLLGLAEERMPEIRGNQISMVFQEPMTSLNPVHTVGAQIDEAIRLHRKLGNKETRALTLEMLKKVGIPRAEAVAEDYAHQLSGGMRQRVMIAMALACQPKLLIADEPTTALDVTIQAQILDLMRQLRNETQAATILITHDLGIVAEMCERVLVMYAGQVVESAQTDKLFACPQHPYTIGLMQSIPQLDKKVSRLVPIPGYVPSLSNMPSGCRFAPRCSRAIDRCLTHNPELLQLEQGHDCRCWLYTKGGEPVGCRVAGS